MTEQMSVAGLWLCMVEAASIDGNFIPVAQAFCRAITMLERMLFG
jgi:hypothetical protein